LRPHNAQLVRRIVAQASYGEGLPAFLARLFEMRNRSAKGVGRAWLGADRIFQGRWSAPEGITRLCSPNRPVERLTYVHSRTKLLFQFQSYTSTTELCKYRSNWKVVAELGSRCRWTDCTLGRYDVPANIEMIFIRELFSRVINEDANSSSHFWVGDSSNCPKPLCVHVC
jgi:hypothetical protein